MINFEVVNLFFLLQICSIIIDYIPFISETDPEKFNSTLY